MLDAWVLDRSDAGSVGQVTDAGLTALVDDLLMRDPDATAAFVRTAVEAVRP